MFAQIFFVDFTKVNSGFGSDRFYDRVDRDHYTDIATRKFPLYNPYKLRLSVPQGDYRGAAIARLCRSINGDNILVIRRGFFRVFGKI